MSNILMPRNMNPSLAYGHINGKRKGLALRASVELGTTRVNEVIHISHKREMIVIIGIMIVSLNGVLV